MKEVFRDAGLSVPWFRMLPIDPTPEPVLLGISYPCVLKPLSLSASQGVVRANNREEFLAAAARVRRLLKSPEILATREANLDQMLVEGYIPGREVAVEGLLIDGAPKILAIFDKPDPLEGPYFEETIYVTPSRLPESAQHAIEKCAREAARALGLSHGRCDVDGLFEVGAFERIGLIEDRQYFRSTIYKKSFNRDFPTRNVSFDEHLIEIRLASGKNLRGFKQPPDARSRREKFLTIVRAHNALTRSK